MSMSVTQNNNKLEALLLYKLQLQTSGDCKHLSERGGTYFNKPNSEPERPKYPDAWYPNVDLKDKSSPFWKGFYLDRADVTDPPMAPGPPPYQLKSNKTSPIPSPLQNLPKNSPKASYWKHTFFIAYLPFMPWGCPIHLLFRHKLIFNRKEWLMSMLCPCPITLSSLLIFLLTIVTAAISIILNAYTAYIIGYFFYILVIQGDASNLNLFPYLLTILRVLPVIIPLDLMWLKGHVVQRLIASFDRVTDLHRRSPMYGTELPKMPSYRLNLVILYSIILCIHVLHVLTDEPHDDNLLSLPVEDLIIKVVADYSLAVMMTLVFPLYCVYVWAIHYELLMLKGYLKSLIRGRVAPKYGHFDECKKSYRLIADHIMCVNGMFCIYLSVLIFDLGSFIYSDFENLARKVMEIFFPKNSGGAGTVLKGLFDSFFGPGPPQPQQPDGSVDSEILSPYQVRLILGNVLIILLYVFLFYWTYWQAVKVNDEVRYLHVWLNDFVSEPESRLNSELYEAFRLLKFYIHSRLEQQRSALLNLTIVGFIPGGFRNRLLAYNVYH